MPRRHTELHRVERIGWLRAAVLGANDGIVSTASLIVGVAAASAGQHQIVVAGVAALVAGAMSMAAGEYVSVSSQRDTERADLARERGELAQDPLSEVAELTQIYIDRGVNPELARTVAEQMMAKDALAAHARDELGLIALTSAKPLQAAFTSAATFATGAAMPLLVALIAPENAIAVLVASSSLLFLAALGLAGARLGGASEWRAAMRVAIWGAAAMASTAAVGQLFGTTVAA